MEVSLDRVYRVDGDREYADVLSEVQEYMSGQQLDVDSLTDRDTFLYKKHIESCITTKGLKCKGVKVLSELVDRLYDSMAKYDILTKYLDPKVYMEIGIEEIYGRWDCIYILCREGKIKLNETFPSKEAADNIFRRIVQRFNGTLNEGTPLALGEFCANIRASFAAPPISPKQYGDEFNIRIVHGSKMTRDLLVNSQTISEDGLNFLELCIRHKIGICISGGTGSGKTGTMYYLLSTVTQDKTYRVGTIEIESREFDLMKYDTEGSCINDVFSWVTRSSEDERQNISANDLLETVLRFKPDIIGVGEMRNKEALIACEAGTTGHGLITTTHCDSAEDTPMRIVELCKKSGGNYDDDTLLRLAVQAFPIIVYQRLEMDGRTRRVYEIAECVGCENGVAKVNNIFEYVVTDNQVEQKKPIGAFQRKGSISPQLGQKLLRNGAPKAQIEQYTERRRSGD